MTILYDGFGAPIAYTVHELDDQSHSPSSYTQPGESWVRCVCGWEGESVASIAGGAIPPGALFRGHLDDVEEQDGPDCGDGGAA